MFMRGARLGWVYRLWPSRDGIRSLEMKHTFTLLIFSCSFNLHQIFFFLPLFLSSKPSDFKYKSKGMSSYLLSCFRASSFTQRLSRTLDTVIQSNGLDLYPFNPLILTILIVAELLNEHPRHPSSAF